SVFDQASEPPFNLTAPDVFSRAESRTQIGKFCRPIDGLKQAGGRVQAHQAGQLVLGLSRNEQILYQSRIGGSSLPPLVAAAQLAARRVVYFGRIYVKLLRCSADLAIEFFLKGSRPVMQGGLQDLPFAGADLTQPVVLQESQQREQQRQHHN